MQKCDALLLGAHPGDFIDEPDTCTAAAIQCSVQIIDSEANVMDTGTAPADELAYRRIGGSRLEQLHERVAGKEPGDVSAIGVRERRFGKSEQVAVQGKNPVECVDGDADVRDPSATRRGLLHAGCSR